MEYMLFLSQNIELLNNKELELKAIDEDKKHQRDQAYVNKIIQEHTNDLANMHKSELKVCEFIFLSPPQYENITKKEIYNNPPNEFMIKRTK